MDKDYMELISENRKNKQEKEVYKKIKSQAKEKWDKIAKPIDSLGSLEEYVCKLCAIFDSVEPPDIKKRAVLVFCGDHGVVAEGVTQTGSEVTKIVALNFAKGCSGVNYLAQVAKADVFPVDMGMNTEVPGIQEVFPGHIIDRKIADGTKNLVQADAMSKEQCRKAIACGMDLVGELKKQGYSIIATGEMGIGNTTPTSILAAKLLGLLPKEVTGRGAGLDDAHLKRKEEVVEKALKRISSLDENKKEDIISILASVGGYEIAGMVGAFLGGVKYNLPIIIDGAISAVACLIATRMHENVPDYALASHVSEEKTGSIALKEMGLSAMLHGKMCLGEGTGAVALLPLLDMGISVYKNMGTFADLQIEAYKREGKPSCEKDE